MGTGDGERATGGEQFATTHWSVVLTAGEASTPHAREALEKLCRLYWYPLYAYVRRQGRGPEEAEDLTQEFFTRLIAKNYLSAVDRRKGKFRSFLLAALEHFLAKQWVRAHAQKRGGRQVFVSFDDEDVETRYQLEKADELTPEKIYDRRWALTLLQQALARLEAECADDSRRALFEQLKPLLSGEDSEASYADIAARVGTTPGAVKVAMHRLRQRYGELLRAEVGHTVARPEEVDDEIRHLLAALSG
ncbi:MAG: sigma-70 family RNA polymerase sigma factor [Verrucomicrobia bacterium]|nr:sigma-70 family RNA polymerase sigma factor [Verrucomicrobiota bacterium]